MKLKILKKNYVRKTKIVQKEAESIILNIEQIRLSSEKYKNVYFWTPPETSSRRKSFRGNKIYINQYFKKLDLKIEFSIDIECSCKNVYKTQELYLNNEKKTLSSLKTIKKDLLMLELTK